MTAVPFVISERDGKERQFDIFSLLLRDRIIFINGVIDDFMANSVVAQFLYLDAEDKDKDISLYINSPGGSVSAGLAIYDTMRHIKADVHTIGIGLAASMGSLLLAGGDKRSVLPHTKIMIHQPLISGGLGGRETDITILAKDLSETRAVISEIFSKHTGRSIKAIEKAIENNRYMNARQALEFGLCDNIVEVA
ncbi:MAG: ATP-dependent Clp protease proteolytic subunit [Spirochaetales bacterium]|nr:ATP-dependent Clp protease proteolytic subunit [Spirochaetales bacterium]